MPTVFVIKGKLHPFIERSSFFHSRYDEKKVVNNGFLVCLKYVYALFLVVAPFCEKFGGKMFVRASFQFSDKGYLLFCDLFFTVGDIK